MDIRLIKLFQSALSTEPILSHREVNLAAMKAGYLVHPDCCNQSVLNFVKSEKINPNSTFYKTWEDITSKPRLELWIDQAIHYITTYGTRFTEDPYVPNSNPEDMDYLSYKIISPITPQDLYDRCLSMVKSGIALKIDTLDAVTQYIISYIQGHPGTPLDLNEITNRDAMCVLATNLKIWPTSGEDIIRVLFGMVYNNPMPIQSKFNLSVLYHSYGSNSLIPKLSNLLEEQVIALASVFYRYKKFLLGFKRNPDNIQIINKISRLAKKYHKPFQAGYWESLTSGPIDHETFLRKLGQLDNNFKIIRLIQMIQYRKVLSNSKEAAPVLYTIRNGSIWYKDLTIPERLEYYNDDLEWVRELLLDKLAENLRLKLKTHIKPFYVKFPENLELACPVSEKQFVGNIPFGSSLKMEGKNNYFGVYWREEWGAHDFDISFIDEAGEKIGWNGSYHYNQICTGSELIYSGDMTSANPEATELLLCRGEKLPNGNLMLNKYCGADNSKFQLLIGQDTCKGFGKNYMVSPDSLFVRETQESITNQMSLGMIKDNRFYFYLVYKGSSTVSINDPRFLAGTRALAQSYLPLQKALKLAGAREWNPELNVEPDLDLTQLDRDTLINLFQ